MASPTSPAESTTFGRYRLVAGPSYWVARAAMKRSAWAAEARRPGVDETAIVAELKRRAQGWAGSKRLARELDVSPSLLKQVFCRRRRVSKRLAGRLGYRRIESGASPRFERVE